MWKTLYTYENYCHDCIWPIWGGAIDVGITAAFLMVMATLYFHVSKEELPKKISTKVFGYTVGLTIPRLENPRKSILKWYFIFIVFLIVNASYDTVYQLVDDSFPDDYLTLDEAVKSKGQCVEGVINRYNYKSLQGPTYDGVVFENGKEFRYGSSDSNRFCYQNARIISGIRSLLPDSFQLDFKGDGAVGNVELRLCWARNVNSSFSIKEISKYDGICIYKIEAKLVDR